MQTQGRRCPRLCVSCLFVCLEKSVAAFQERMLSIPAGGTTDLPLGSPVNDLLLFTNELNTEQVGTRVTEGRKWCMGSKQMHHCVWDYSFRALVMII